jgi:hypothetical protein
MSKTNKEKFMFYACFLDKDNNIIEMRGINVRNEEYVDAENYVKIDNRHIKKENTV